MNNDHTPDPEFVGLLERDLKSTIRRQTTFHGSSGGMRPVALRLAPMAALAVVSMLIGGAGANAVTRSADRVDAALHIARGEALLEIARMQLEYSDQQMVEIHSLFERQVVTKQELRRSEAQHSQAESQTNIRVLELAETLITGKEPVDSLSAPRVAGRDFVTERMAARRRPMQRRLELVIEQARGHQELFDAGAVDARELKAGQTAVVAAEEELTGLEKRIALRASLLAGDLSAADVELRGMRFAAVAARNMALRQLEILVEKHKRFTQLSERGFVSAPEFRAVKAELRTVEARVQLAELELRILDQKLDDVSRE